MVYINLNFGKLSDHLGEHGGLSVLLVHGPPALALLALPGIKITSHEEKNPWARLIIFLNVGHGHLVTVVLVGAVVKLVVGASNMFLIVSISSLHWAGSCSGRAWS